MASRALNLQRESPPRIGDGPIGASKVSVRVAGREDLNTPEWIAKWDSLSQRAAEPNPFFESWYLLPSLRLLDPEGDVRLLIFEVEGQLAGIMPVRKERSYYGHALPHWRCWIHPNCFLGVPLVSRDFEAEYWREVLRWTDENAGGGLFLHLPEMPLDGPLQCALIEVLAERSRPAALVHCYERAILRSDLSPEEYYERSVNKKRRKEYRRREKRLAEQGDLVVERMADTTGIETWIEEFLALERSGWKGDADSALASSPATEVLFREVALEAAGRGKFDRLTMRLDGKPIAMLTSFLTPPGAFGFKTAYDEAFRAFSPGVYLQREFLEILHRGEIEWSDSCAAPDHPMIDHFWRERRAIGRVNVAIGGAARRSLFKLLARLETGAFPKGLK